MRCRLLGVLPLVLLTVAGTVDASAKSAQKPLGLRLELGTMIGYDERQIEGVGQDDSVTQDFNLTLSFSALYNAWRGLSFGLLVDYDRTLARLQAAGDASSAWELNLGLLLRYTYKYFFAQAGYLFGMWRNDSFRTDLPAVNGDNTSTLFGSHSIAWLVGVGAQYPINPRVHLFFKFDYRIRYFVSRGGSSLEGGREYGGQSLYPYVGVAYTF